MSPSEHLTSDKALSAVWFITFSLQSSVLGILVNQNSPLTTAVWGKHCYHLAFKTIKIGWLLCFYILRISWYLGREWAAAARWPTSPPSSPTWWCWPSWCEDWLSRELAQVSSSSSPLSGRNWPVWRWRSLLLSSSFYDYYCYHSYFIIFIMI